MNSSAKIYSSLHSNSHIMKKTVLVLIQVLVAGLLFGQAENLMLKSGDHGFYIEHRITPKENFYSIGRLFNVPPKDIAAFNSLNMEKGLSIGQVIKIPLIETNFSQNVNEGVPVYIVTKEKESLAHISSREKASVENLKAWNHLTGDNASAGTKLIAGFLTSGELAKANNMVIIKRQEPVNKQEAVKKETEAVKKPEVISETASNTNLDKQENKEINKMVKEGPQKVEEVKEAAKADMEVRSGYGYFKDNFEQQIKEYPLSKAATVTSGIFKTISGWKDAKYYALMDGVDPGTVIKVTNPSNNKSVYAKVLGGMKGIRQNQGLDLRISDAASSQLNITDGGKFIVKVDY